MILDQIAGSRYSHAAGTAATVTVPAGYIVTGISAFASSASAITITPGGAGQDGAALTAITLPASSGWYHAPANVFLGQLGGGSVIVFASTAAYVVYYAKIGAS